MYESRMGNLNSENVTDCVHIMPHKWKEMRRDGNGNTSLFNKTFGRLGERELFGRYLRFFFFFKLTK